MARECLRMEKQVSFSQKPWCLTLNILLSLIKNDKHVTKLLHLAFLSDSLFRRDYDAYTCKFTAIKVSKKSFFVNPRMFSFRSEYAHCTTLSKLQSESTIWIVLHTLNAKTVKWKSSLQGLWVV